MSAPIVAMKDTPMGKAIPDGGCIFVTSSLLASGM